MLRNLSLAILLVLVLAAPVYAQDFENYVTSQWNTYCCSGSNNFTSMSTSSQAINHYNLQPVLMGARTAHQAFGDDVTDRTWLDRWLVLVENSVTAANVTDSSGAKNWNCKNSSGTQTDFACWTSNGITNGGSFLSEITAVREMARVVQYINSNSALASTVSPTGATYGVRANAIRSWLHTNMVIKWLVTRSQLSHATSFVFDDKAIHILHLVMALGEGGLSGTTITGSTTYRSYAVQILNAHMASVSEPAGNGIAAAGGAIWHYNLYTGNTNCGGSSQPQPCSVDTSHGNRWPDTLQYAVDLGFGSSISVNSSPGGLTLPLYMPKLERLFSQIIWDGSTANPRFTNYTDGDNNTFSAYGPYANGYVAQGWGSVAHHDADGVSAMVSMTNCVIASAATCTSPSRTVTANASTSRFSLAATTAYAQFRLTGGGTPTPVLATSPGSLNFSGFVGGGNPVPQNISITDTASSGAMSWVVTDDQTWMLQTPTSGNNAGTVVVSVVTTGLAAGVHTGNITITADGATSSPDVIPVTLTMIPPTLTRTPTTLSFTAEVGGPNPTNKSFQITDTSGSGVMAWTVSDDVAWISTSPSSGISNTQVTVSIDITGLPSDTYNGTITITSTGSVNSPLTIPVDLVVTDPPAPPCHRCGGRIR